MTTYKIHYLIKVSPLPSRVPGILRMGNDLSLDHDDRYKKEPATCNLQPATCNLHPATRNQHPATNH